MRKWIPVLVVLAALTGSVFGYPSLPLGGYVFVLIGVVMAASAFMPVQTGWPIVGVLAGCAVVAHVVYSYIVWRNDPDRRGLLGPR